MAPAAKEPMRVELAGTDRILQELGYGGAYPRVVTLSQLIKRLYGAKATVDHDTACRIGDQLRALVAAGWVAESAGKPYRYTLASPTFATLELARAIKSHADALASEVLNREPPKPKLPF